MRRRLAKATYGAGGLLSRVKTPRRTYRVASVDPLVTEASERRWLPCRLSTRLLALSMRLDWDHWDHWACVHEHCDPAPCPECGGLVCADEDVALDLSADR